jgi:hypothetical protein
VLSGIEMPGFNFEKKEPAGFASHAWHRIERCRFTKCTIPASFLLTTHNCVFEDCRFVDDREPPAVVNKPLEVVLYTADCKSTIRSLPEPLKLTEKPLGAVPGSPIPTEEEVTAMIQP